MRIAIIGLGNQGRKRQVVAGHDVVATVDPYNPEAAYKEVGQIPLNFFDAGFVCTSDDAKPEIVEYLIGAGKHVLVEKPLLISDAEYFSKLSDLGAKNGVVCYTGYNHRFEPHIGNLKKVLETGELGAVYSIRFFYGNGTARDTKLSDWRDQGMGVISDLGSHLLDLSLFLFGEQRTDFELWSGARFENRAFDHAIFASRGKPLIEMEVSLLSWRNNFTIDLYAEAGSAHIAGLCKWGPSSFTVRRRILPSGKPTEECSVLERSDPTWELEYQHFKDLCQAGHVDCGRDQWIDSMLHNLTRDGTGQ